jgi:hypothetical protein
VRNIPIPCFATFIKEFDVAHAIAGGIFTILLIIHVWLNRKPLFRYFGKLGWWWFLVGLGFAAIIWGGIVITLLVALGKWG